MQITTPILRRNIVQSFTGPGVQTTRVDFDLAYNEGILLKQYIPELENLISNNSIIAMCLNSNPTFVAGSLTLGMRDVDTLRCFTWEQQQTTSGTAAIQGWGLWEPPWNDFFKVKGYLVFSDLSVHFMTIGAADTQAGVHRLFYNRVKLDTNEIALLGQRSRG